MCRETANDLLKKAHIRAPRLVARQQNRQPRAVPLLRSLGPHLPLTAVSETSLTLHYARGFLLSSIAETPYWTPTIYSHTRGLWHRTDWHGMQNLVWW